MHCINIDSFTLCFTFWLLNALKVYACRCNSFVFSCPPPSFSLSIFWMCFCRLYVFVSLVCVRISWMCSYPLYVFVSLVCVCIPCMCLYLLCVFVSCCMFLALLIPCISVTLLVILWLFVHLLCITTQLFVLPRVSLHHFPCASRNCRSNCQWIVEIRLKFRLFIIYTKL